MPPTSGRSTRSFSEAACDCCGDSSVWWGGVVLRRHVTGWVVAVGLSLLGCGGAQAAPESGRRALPAESPRRFEACALSEETTLQVPIPREHALAVQAQACMLVDERDTATAVTFAALAADAEGAELSVHNPQAFFVETGLLGADAVAQRGPAVSFLGRGRPALSWSGTPQGLPPREGFAFAVRRGAVYIVVTAMHPPDGESADHLRQLVADVTD